MYVPHEYGIVNISQNDLETLKWLYKLPVGATQQEILSMYSGLGARSVDELIYKLQRQDEKSEFEKTKDSLLSQAPKKDLLEENANIGDLKKYLMGLNNIKVDFKPKR